MGVWAGTFNHEDEVPQHHLQQEDKKQVNADGAGTASQRLPEHAGFINELEQLEHPQDAPELEHPQQQFTANLRHEEKQHR